MALTEKGVGELANLIKQEKQKAWSEGYYAGATENYDPADEEESQELKDRADSRNPYKEQD